MEYAVLLGLIGATVLAGTLVLGSSVRETAQKLTQETVGDGGGTLGQNSGATSTATLLSMVRNATALHGRTVRVLIVWAVALVVTGLGFVRLCYWFHKRRRQTPSHADQGPSPSEEETLELQTRIYAKRQSLLRALSNDSDLLTRNQVAARHLMTKQLLVVSPTTSVAELKTLMESNRVHHLLVCEKGMRLVGVVSDRDLHGRGKTARAVMTPRPYSVAPDTPLGPAITCLINRHISCLPVVENGRLVGVITTVDLALVTQCVLQLWLRLARQSQDTPGWSEELVKVAEIVERDLNDQHLRLAGLSEVLGHLAHCAADRPCNLVVAQIEEILGATKRLTDLITKTHGAIQTQCKEKTIAVDSRTDPLTGLISRRGLEEILETMLAVKTSGGQPLSLLLMAIEGDCGESDLQAQEPEPRTMKAVAESVVAEVRDTDLVARYRPDTIAVVLPHTGPEGTDFAGHRIAEAAQAKLCGREPRFKVRLHTVSAVAGEPLEDFLSRADAALAEPADAEAGAPCLAGATGLGSTSDTVVTP